MARRLCMSAAEITEDDRAKYRRIRRKILFSRRFKSGRLPPQAAHRASSAKETVPPFHPMVPTSPLRETKKSGLHRLTVRDRRSRRSTRAAQVTLRHGRRTAELWL